MANNDDAPNVPPEQPAAVGSEKPRPSVHDTYVIAMLGLDDDLAELLRPYLVDFRVFLDDISAASTEELLQRPVEPEVQLMLFALRFSRDRKKFLHEVPKLEPLVTHNLEDHHWRLVVKMFFVYIKQVAKVPEAKMQALYELWMDDRWDPAIMAVLKEMHTLREAQRQARTEGRAEGKREGEQIGEKRGKLEATRAMLQRQLTQRFGPLSPTITARLNAATLSQLDAMTLRILAATNIDDVFADQ